MFGYRFESWKSGHIFFDLSTSAEFILELFLKWSNIWQVIDFRRFLMGPESPRIRSRDPWWGSAVKTRGGNVISVVLEQLSMSTISIWTD